MHAKVSPKGAATRRTLHYPDHSSYLNRYHKQSFLSLRRSILATFIFTPHDLRHPFTHVHMNIEICGPA